MSNAPIVINLPFSSKAGKAELTASDGHFELHQLDAFLTGLSASCASDQNKMTELTSFLGQSFAKVIDAIHDSDKSVNTARLEIGSRLDPISNTLNYTFSLEF